MIDRFNYGEPDRDHQHSALPPVTLVTGATGRADDLADQDYRDIFGELRERRSLADFVRLTQTTVSRSWWSQYEAGTKALDWQRKNELRRAVGLSDLAPSVSSALSQIDPDAKVWRVGAGVPDTVILVTPELPSGSLLIVNGTVHIAEPGRVANFAAGNVTGVTAVRRVRRPTAAIGGLQPATRVAHDARRRALGLTWDAYLQGLLGGEQ